MSHPTTFDSGPADAWHSHKGEAAPQDTHGETNPATIAIVGIVGMIIVVVLILILTKYFDVIVMQEKVVKLEEWDVRSEMRSTEAQWQQTLSGYGWVDAAAGTVSTPVEQAMQTVASEYARGQ